MLFKQILFACRMFKCQYAFWNLHFICL
uniref:Uncharacterized protein n=1 Tax=Arundo donax TaxID=35708 RepID=A0A0A9FUL0_ARUDO